MRARTARRLEAEAAVELFQTALGLPGKGAMRLKTSPREYR